MRRSAPCLLLDLAELSLDDLQDACFFGDDVEEVFDRFEQGVVFLLDALALEAGELIEAQVEDVADLLLGESILPFDNPSLIADQDSDLLDGFARPRERHQLCFGVVAVPGIADDLDEIVEVRQSDEVAFELLRLDFGLPEKKACPAQHDLAPVLDVARDRVLEREQLRLARDRSPAC